MKTHPVLELQNVTRRFSQGSETVYALRETNFHIQPGEFVAIIGPSGSGKSTFLTVAGGLRNPSEGTVKVDGVDITSLPPKRLSQIRLKHIGFILQASSLVPYLTVEKQLQLLDKVSHKHGAGHAKTKLFEELGIARLAKNTRVSCLAVNVSASRLQKPCTAILTLYWPMSRPRVWTPSAPLTS